MRSAAIRRDTKETQIELALELDGSGKSEISSGCGFLDHMLELFARHGDLDLKVVCRGDVQVDDHHSVEDIGICLGKAFTEALGLETEVTSDAQRLCRADRMILPGVGAFGNAIEKLKATGLIPVIRAEAERKRLWRPVSKHLFC